jgi:resuscitation-promoting factor RpfB
MPTDSGGISGAAIAGALGGSLLVYVAVKNTSIGNTIRSFAIAGQAPAVASTGPATNAEPPNGAGGSGATIASGTNKALGKLMAGTYGWAFGAQWTALNNLWTRESGWRTTAKNPSGAYGIPQALPESKLPFAGQARGGSNAAAQISWGLKYIKEHYGDPITAWAHEQSAGWY